MKILLIEDNSEEANKFQEFFKTCGDVHLVGVTGSASEGLLLTQKHFPDAIILDIELEEGNGITFLPALKKLEIPAMPYVVVTTWTTEHRTIQAMKNNGAGFVQLKSNPGYFESGPHIVFSILKAMEPFFQCNQNGVSVYPAISSPATAEALKRERISDALGRIDINRGGMSQAYLEEAIYVASEAFSEGALCVDMDGVVYPALEKKFKLDRVSLEKSMRKKIEHAWQHVDVATLAREYAQYVEPDRGKPMLRDFIAYYAKKIS